MKRRLSPLLNLLCLALFVWLGTQPVSGTVSVTAATNGTAISADTAATGGSGAWTTLGAITITEGANGDFAVGTNVTLVLRTPAGFEFNTGVTPTVTFTADRGIESAAVVMTDATNLTVTLTVTNNTSLDILTIGGGTAIEVRPTAGTPLATGRRIYRPTTGAGTATITGITTSTDGTSGTSFGPLTEVVGAATAIRVETLATGAGTVVPAQNRTSGTALTVFSIVRDAFGNFITNIAADAWSLPVKTDGVVDGDLVAAGNLKSAVFTARLTGTATIRATSGALTTTDSGTLTVVPGAPNKMIFTTAPQALTAGVISSVMTVQIQDLNGNPTNAASARTVTLTKSSAAGVFRDVTDGTNITSVIIPIGSSTGSFLYRDTLAGSPILTASTTGGLTSGTQTQTVAAASAALVRVETTATGSGTVVATQNVSAGNSITNYSIARDAFTNFIANVAADAWSLPTKTGGVDDADLVPSGDSKSAVFSGRLTGTAIVRATSGALTSVDSGTLTVVAGTATRLFVTLPGQTFTAGAGISGTPSDQTAGATFVITKLTAVDNFTNIATAYAGSKTIAYTGPGGTATYTTPVSFTAGQSTTALNTILRKAETTTLTASSATAPAVTGVTSSSFTVNPNAFARLQLLAPGETAAPGTTTGKTGTPTARTAAVAFAVTVNGVDTNWNVINTITDTVGITSSDANAELPVDAALTAGTQTFNVTLKTAGSRTLTATDISDGTKTANTSPAITVNAGAFAKLQLLVPGEVVAPGTVTGKTGAPSAQTAGTQFTVTVNGVDANWNLVTAAPANIIGILASDANATLPANNSLSSGTRNFNVTLKTAGSHTLTATNITDVTKTPDTSPAITLNAGAFTKLQLLAPGETAAPGTATGKTGTPSAQPAGSGFSVTVNAVDANWNLINTNDTVAITSSDANAALPANAALAAGTQSFSVTLKTAGARTVTASDVTHPTITANTSPSITVGADVFTQLQLLMPGETAAPGSATGKTGAATARTAGTAFSVTVNAVDANWNLINTNDTVAITSSDVNATLPTNAPLVAGTRAFSVTLTTSGTQSVTATDVTNGGITAGTGSALVNPAAASKLVIATEPSSTAVVGVPFAQQPVILIADAFNNVRSNDTLIVTASRVAGAGGLLGTTNMAAVGGVVTYTNLAHSLATNITLRFANGTLTSVTSAPVAVSVGGFARLLALLPGETHAPGTPTGKTGTPAATAGSNTPVRVLATDSNFNLVDTVTDTVGLTTTDANAVLPVDVALINGTNTLDLTFKTAGAQTVTATDISDGSKTASAAAVTVSPGAFVKLQLLVPGETAAPGSATGKTGTPDQQLAGTAFNAVVNAVDANWNLTPSATGSSHTVALTSTDTNATLGSLNLASGTRIFAVTLRTAGLNTITASHVDDPTKTASTSPDITVVVGPFVKLQLLVPGEAAAPGTTTGKTGTPTAHTAGVPFNITVNAVDAAWNLISTNDTVRITATDTNAVLPADTALVNGTQTLSVTLNTAGTRTVTAANLTHPAITANTSPSLTVNPAAYAALQVIMPGETAAPGTATGKTGTPTARVAGTAFTTLTVNAVDALWNIVPTNATVAVTSSDTNAVLPASSALGTDGTKNNFAFTFKTAGNHTITATDVGDATKTNTSALTVVSAGAFTKLQLLVPGETAVPGSVSGKTGAPLTQTSNVTFSVTVQSVDANWNLISTNDTIRITSSDTNAIMPANAALVAGARSFNVALLTAGTATVTASNLTHTVITPNTSPAITVIMVSDQTITFGPLTNKTYGDAPFNVSATASSGLPVSFSILSGPATILSNTVTITGVGSVTVRASQAGSSNYFAAPDVDQPFTVAPATLTVTADDLSRPYGATNPTFTASYTGFVNSENSGVLSGAPGLSTTATTNSAPGPYTITAATGTLSATNYTFAFVDGTLTVTAPVPTRLDLATPPSTNATAGVVFAQQPVIHILDEVGNLLATDNSTVVTAARAAGTGALQGTTSLTAVNGIVTFTNLAHNVATNITIQFAASGLTGTNSEAIAIAPATADRLVFTTQPGAAVVESPFGTQPVIKSRDAFGNDSTNGLPANLDVTIALTAGTGPLLGTTNLDIGTAAGNGVTAFTNLQIDAYGADKQLTASATGLSNTVSEVFIVTPLTPVGQTITFNPVGSRTYGDAPFAPDATASSGLPVSFSILAGPATVSNNLVIVTGLGTVTVVASQPGDAIYAPAEDVYRGFNVGAKTLTPVVTANNKPYDGGTNATIASRSLVGVVGADDVTLTNGTASFDNKNAGTGKTVTVTGLSLGGADIANYTLASSNATTTANILQLAVTGSVTVTNKVYDGTTNAVIVDRDLSGVLGGDDATLSGGLASFDDKNVGTNKNVTITGLGLSGADAGNYSLNSTNATANADITERALNVGATGINKTYDATNTATVTLTDDRVVGDALATAYTNATFADALVGTAKPVSVLGISVSGADAANYLLANTSTNTTADITPALLTPSITADNKVYDGTTIASIATRSVTGIIGTDNVALAGGTASFADASAGTNKTVTGFGFTLTGADAANYALGSTNALTTANIAPVNLTITANDDTKSYDGLGYSGGNGVTYAGFVNGETNTALGGTLTYGGTSQGATNVGSYVITPGGLTSGNYAIAFANGTLSITSASSVAAIGSSLNPSSPGSNVTFTATIGPVAPATTTPTGNVQFLTNGVALGSPVTLSGGVANVSTASLPSGTNTVTAQYLGDGNYLGSSDSLAQVVFAPAATPEVLGIVKNGDGSVTVTFGGTPGAEYYVSATTNLALPGSWVNVSTNTANGGGQWTYTDTTAASNTQRFFRAAKP